jgi:hypothetical protein
VEQPVLRARPLVAEVAAQPVPAPAEQRAERPTPALPAAVLAEARVLPEGRALKVAAPPPVVLRRELPWTARRHRMTVAVVVCQVPHPLRAHSHRSHWSLRSERWCAGVGETGSPEPSEETASDVF